ncbi:MAG: hypothetical protein KF748_10360 [Xanthobacteraceae bacterium]|nr:hypothetical protein [Xanthobacteraceae bacterium]
MPAIRRKTYKTEIILRLFQERWDAKSRTLKNPVVYSTEIREQHAAYRRRRNESVENINPPAFIKDFLRKTSSANQNWPAEVFKAGYSARQVTGGGKVFEFVEIAPGQKEPFLSTAPTPLPKGKTYKISSVSMPLASRRLGRTDEPWLVQVSVRLHVVETYFALYSSRRAAIRQVDHLQNALKLRKTEIDAVFLGIEEDKKGGFTEFLISCEAKTVGQDIITEQVLAQVKAVFTLSNLNQKFVVPIAIKSISPSVLQVVEYRQVSREDAATLETLSPVNQAVFQLVPPVPGIGQRMSTRKT